MSENSESPLAEVVRDRRINNLLEAIRQAVRENRPITIEPKDVHYIQRSFQKGLALGELKLYELARKILSDFTPQKKIKFTLIVWGRCRTQGHDEVLVNEVDLSDTPERLTAVDDTLLSGSHPPVCAQCGLKTSVIASFVRHTPLEAPECPIEFLQTRIKTTSNICYKVADLVFDIDFMFQRDKIYNEFSQIVTDMYGIKIITRNPGMIPEIVGYFHSLPGGGVVSEKDYLGANKKKSGFEAFKLVFRRERQLFEIQIQSREMYGVERDSRDASHKTYKERQMTNRMKLGREYIELYQALSQIFSIPEQNYCSIEYIEIGQTRKGLDDEF